MRQCHCVRCVDCNGSGRVEYKTGGYPEYELESCDQCDGYGVVETCDYCHDAEELEQENI